MKKNSTAIKKTEPTFVHRAAITGPICSGKSSGMAFLRSSLEDMGYIVAVSPEVARDLMESGIDPRSKLYANTGFQEELIRQMICMEEVRATLLSRAFAPGRKRVLLTDRGTPDSKIYVAYPAYRAALRANGLTVIGGRDRYHSVHLLQAPPRHAFVNDAARTEPYEASVQMQKDLWKAWSGHEGLQPLVVNGASFEDKMHRLLESVCRAIGSPEPLQHEQVYRVKPMTSRSIPEDATRAHIEQVYLMSLDPLVEVSIRKRGTEEEGYAYYYREKSDHASGSRIKRERLIEEPEYEHRKRTERQRGVHVIRKIRTCFWIDNKSYRYDRFQDKLSGLHLLSINHTKRSGFSDPLPGHLISRLYFEVTENPLYRNASLARLRKAPALP